MDTQTLFAGVLLGALGMGYLVYGKKQQRGVPLLAGIALMVLPYVVTNTILLVFLGVVLIALPFVFRV